jgi:hypothetical protein
MVARSRRTPVSLYRRGLAADDFGVAVLTAVPLAKLNRRPVPAVEEV